MFDIYKLLYFIEETGLLIQDKWYKVTHPEVWDRPHHESQETEEYPSEEDISEGERIPLSPDIEEYIQGSDKEH